MIAAITILTFWATFFGVMSFTIFQNESSALINSRLNRFIWNNADLEPEINLEESSSPTKRRLKVQLKKLGLHRQSDLDAALMFRRICYVTPFMLITAVYLMGFPTDQVLLLGIIFTVIFIIVPRIMLLRSAMQRKRSIQKNLPDTLDLLILCIEAGLSFDSSLVRVAEEQRRVCSHMSRELILTNQEILAGKERREALNNLADRVGVDDMNSLVGAILQATKLGTSLVKTLRTQASTVRKRTRERVRAQILKTPVKLMFPLIFFIFPTLLTVILAPTFIQIFRQLTKVGF